MSMSIEINQEKEPVWVEISELHNDNLIDSKESICLHCEDKVGVEYKPVDIMLSRKLIIKNVKAFVCNECGNPTAFMEETVKEIQDEIEAFKASRPTIDELLPKDREDSYRWCSSQLCACAGAANCSGELSSYLYSKADWIKWKALTPKRINKFMFFIKDYEHKMEAVTALSQFFHFGKKDVLNIFKSGQLMFGVEYNDGSQDEINKDVENMISHFSSKGITLEKEDYYSSKLATITFGRDIEQ